MLVQMGAVEWQKAERQTRDWSLGLRRVRAGAECSQTLEARSTTYRSAEDLGCINIESEPNRDPSVWWLVPVVHNRQPVRLPPPNLRR